MRNHLFPQMLAILSEIGAAHCDFITEQVQREADLNDVARFVLRALGAQSTTSKENGNE